MNGTLVRVTREHILRGDGSWADNPIALAARDAGFNEAEAYIEDFGDCVRGMLYWSSLDDEGINTGEYMDEPVERWLFRFLSGQPVESIEFVMDGDGPAPKRWYQRKVYEINHFYDKPTTAPEFVSGWYNPTAVLGYLQSIAEDKIANCTLRNRGAAALLVRFYGFRREYGPCCCHAKVDLYWASEHRKRGPRWHHWVAKALLWRPSLHAMLRYCVE